MSLRLFYGLTFKLLIPIVCGNLLSPGIVVEVLELEENKYQLLGIPQSALNGTEVEIRMLCGDDSDFEFQVEYVMRSSPCSKEFIDAKRGGERVVSLLQFYFDHDHEIPKPYDYKTMVYYKSKEDQTFNCRDANGPIIFTESKMGVMEQKDLSEVSVRKRSPPGLNGDSIDGGAKNSLSSWHPAVRVPVDGIYFLILKLRVRKTEPEKRHNVTMTVEWRQPHGYLSAIDYPLQRFYIVMCIFYGTLSFIWLFMCIKYFRDILRIQYWIGVVIILGMVEKAVFYSEYSAMNNTGESVDGLIELAELVSCAKRTMSRVLIIIVSVGYGVVKPRLGQTLGQVSLTGMVYFTFGAVEGLARVSKNHVEAQKQKQFAALPLLLTEMTIFYWIFTSLTATMRTLQMKRNEVKLAVFRHFMNTLCFAVLASVIFMMWSLHQHILPSCLYDWKEIWIDTAFWHVLFCSILVVIMFLWRPSNNNQQYAFTPLLDYSDDDEDEILTMSSQAPIMEAVKQRDTSGVRDKQKQREANAKDSKLQEDLKWIEDNIPTSLTDHLLMDDDLDKEARELERSKML